MKETTKNAFIAHCVTIFMSYRSNAASKAVFLNLRAVSGFQVCRESFRKIIV